MLRKLCEIVKQKSCINDSDGLNVYVPSPDSCVEGLTPNVTALGDSDCEGVIKVKRGHKSGSLS